MRTRGEAARDGGRRVAVAAVGSPATRGHQPAVAGQVTTRAATEDDTGRIHKSACLDSLRHTAMARDELGQGLRCGCTLLGSGHPAGRHTGTTGTTAAGGITKEGTLHKVINRGTAAEATAGGRRQGLGHGE